MKRPHLHLALIAAALLASTQPVVSAYDNTLLFQQAIFSNREPASDIEITSQAYLTPILNSMESRENDWYRSDLDPIQPQVKGVTLQASEIAVLDHWMKNGYTE